LKWRTFVLDMVGADGRSLPQVGAKRDSRPPPLPGRRCEKITVRESDYHRCGHDLTMLRAHRIISHSQEPPKIRQLESLSPKSAFAKQCRAKIDLRDPWRGLRNPEFTRETRDADHTLNQVWPERLPRERSYKEIASSQSSFAQACRPDSRSPQTKVGRRGRSTGSTLSPLSSRSPRSDGSVDQDGQLRLPVQSRIQPFVASGSGSSQEDDELEWSAAVRTMTQNQRFGLRPLSGPRSHYDATSRAAWLSLDHHTGSPRMYQKAAAERMEKAYTAGRSSVPLIGLGRDVDNCIVQFSPSEEDDHMVEVSPKGRCRDVLRIDVPGDMTEHYVYVTLDDGKWRLVPERQALRQRAADAADGLESVVEIRKVALTGAQLVSSPRRLPPLASSTHTFFMNPGMSACSLQSSL